MGLILQTVLTGVVTGVVTSALWATIVLVYTKFKDISITGAFRESIQSSSAIVGDVQSFGIGIHNTTGWPVIVRSAWLDVPHEGRMTLRYEGKLEPEYDDHVLLKPDIRGFWICEIEHSPSDVTGGGVEIEYSSPLGVTRVRQVALSDRLAHVIAQSWKSARQSCDNAKVIEIPELVEPADER
jgi:hypothetical protein